METEIEQNEPHAKPRSREEVKFPLRDSAPPRDSSIPEMKDLARCEVGGQNLAAWIDGHSSAKSTEQFRLGIEEHPTPERRWSHLMYQLSIARGEWARAVLDREEKQLDIELAEDDLRDLDASGQSVRREKIALARHRLDMVAIEKRVRDKELEISRMVALARTMEPATEEQVEAASPEYFRQRAQKQLAEDFQARVLGCDKGNLRLAQSCGAEVQLADTPDGRKAMSLQWPEPRKELEG